MQRGPNFMEHSVCTTDCKLFKLVCISAKDITRVTVQVITGIPHRTLTTDKNT